ncbi:MAG: penicillin acylase family protein [Bacteroidetes bacterium]|nr:MAG: penicillin acylase family protein [Bacteroidota bacterium]
MKIFKLGLSLVLTLATFYALNTKLGSLPPLGKFLSPNQGVWQNEITESDKESAINLTGLSAPVTVKYDSHLIPHIFAENKMDLYKAQGYVTAQHRLWQMEFQTHAASGRLSEIVGESALNYDRTERRRGMVYGAEQKLKNWETDQEVMNYVNAYADGVNQYINSLKPGDLPVEYKLLDYAPEQWTTKKTALLLMYMTKMLAGGDSDLEYTNFLKKYGKERFDILYPDFFDVNDPIIPAETEWSTLENAVQTPIPNSEMPLDYIAETIEKPHPDNGSNNWAVSPDKSYSGNPILANDPHLGLNLPSIWYAMQLTTPEQNTFGVSLPGAVGIVIGFNENIAWGMTNATRDVIDWYKIEFEDKTNANYKYDNAWKATTKRVEEIKIRGKETYLDTVNYTHHGPVTYDANFKGNGEKIGYAMRWTGHLGGQNQRTLLDLNTSKNYEDYKNAIKTYVAPAQNVIFASTEGDIALWIQGKFPNKWKGQGKFLMDGSNPEHDWQSFIPQEHNAHTKNPERGFISSANQHPVDPSYPYYVFNDGYETYRNRVINDFFRSKEKFDIQDFKNLHNNNFNLQASELLPTMITVIEKADLSSNEQDILSKIKSWKYNNDIDEAGPTIWQIWYDKLATLTWDEIEKDSIALDYPFKYQTVYMLKNFPNDKFMDNLETPEIETANDLFIIAFKDAVVKLNELQTNKGTINWGEAKATYIGHLLQALPAFSRHDLPIGGYSGIVNATSQDHGPSWRMIVEMTSPPTALGVYPGGQSGNPGSKYYDDFVDTWAAGEYFKLNFMQNKDQNDDIIFSQTLNPSNE